MYTFLLLLQIVNSSWDNSLDSAHALFREGKFAEAKSALSETLVLADAMPATHPARAVTLNSLGFASLNTGDLPDARKRFEDALETLRHVPDADALFINVYANLGQVQFQQGDLPNAERNLRRAIEISAARRGEDDKSTVELESLLFGVLLETGRVDDASRLLDRALSILRAHRSSSDATVINTALRLSRVLIERGECADARKLLAEIEPGSRGTIVYGDVLSNLGDAYRTEGDFARAAPILRKALAEARRTNNLPLMAPALFSLAFIDIAEGRPKLAEIGLRENLRIMDLHFGRNSPARGATLVHLAFVQAQQGFHAAAIDSLNQAALILEASFPATHPNRILERFVRAASDFALGRTESSARLSRDGQVLLAVRPAVEQANLLRYYGLLFRKLDPGAAKKADRQSRELMKGFKP